MQADFHYYAAYCAAIIAGWSHEESLVIAWADQFTDCCSRTFLASVKGPLEAATTQLQLELVDAHTDISGLQDITRIWSSFHFLPGDLHAPVKGCRAYRDNYRLICRPDSDLAVETVRRVKGKGLEAAGLAMHVLCDTWAHQYFAGTPSMVINNVDDHFTEVLPDGERPIRFRHSISEPDDLEKGLYTCSVAVTNENSIMNLGHGRAGHFPDYSCVSYRYLPAWADYEEITKNNPSDYWHAFAQMVCALQYLKGNREQFEKRTYAFEALDAYSDQIQAILRKRQPDASADWKAFGEQLSGMKIPDFSYASQAEAYTEADPKTKDDTVLGRYLLAALSQKSFVTGMIAHSGNRLAGISVSYSGKKFKGIRDYRKLIGRKGEAS